MKEDRFEELFAATMPKVNEEFDPEVARKAWEELDEQGYHFKRFALFFNDGVVEKVEAIVSEEGESRLVTFTDGRTRELPGLHSKLFADMTVAMKYMDEHLLHGYVHLSTVLCRKYDKIRLFENLEIRSEVAPVAKAMSDKIKDQIDQEFVDELEESG